MLNMPSDALICKYDKQYYILIKSDLTPNLRALKLAHELGHYLSHSLNKLDTTIIEIRQNEKNADLTAFNLLMSIYKGNDKK